MLSTNVIERVIECACQTGADYAEIFVENTVSNTLNMSGGIITSALSGRDRGASVRIFCGLDSYYGFTTDLSEEGLLQLAARVAGALTLGKKIKLPTLVQGEIEKPNKTLILPSYLSNKAKAEALRTAYYGAKDASDMCGGITAMYKDIEQNVQIATTDGKIYTECRPYTRLQVSLAASNGRESQMGFEDYMEALGFDCIVRLDPASIGKAAASDALSALAARPCRSGEMPVIFAPSGGGTFLHEACGHPLEASYAARMDTLFHGSIGKKMMSEKVSITDNGLFPNGWGSTGVDDEGIPSRRNVLVENGIVKGFMIDRLNGRRMGMAPTGNGRKQSYRMLPTSRMHQLYIEPGSDSLSDMLSGVDDGLYIEQVGGGCANGNTGAFTVALAKAFVIRKGSICERVRGATLMGKTLEVMSSCDMVGSDKPECFGGGYCGADSGNLPVGNSTPHIRIGKVKIAGRN